MRKLIILPILLLLAAGCEQSFDTVVDPQESEFQVLSMAPSETIVYEEGADSSVTVSISFTSDTSIDSVFAELYDRFNDPLISAPVMLVKVNDDGENGMLYRGEFYLGSQRRSGYHHVHYYIREGNAEREIAKNSFYFERGFINILPEIVEVVAPDSVARGQEFTFTVEASDPNGDDDVRYVYFNLFRPDGSAVIDDRINSPNWYMDNNGPLAGLGDADADDMIWTFTNYFGATAPEGNWRFEFYVEDFQGGISQPVIKNIKLY